MTMNCASARRESACHRRGYGCPGAWVDSVFTAVIGISFLEMSSVLR